MIFINYLKHLNKNKIASKLVFLGLLPVFILVSTVYAASSSFFTQAQKFYNQNCTKPKLSDSLSLACYVFDKVNELDQVITNQNSRLNLAETNIATHSGQIGDIYNNLAKIQSASTSGIPGPKGDKGDRGDPGPQGSAGIIGAGNIAFVFDDRANRDTLWILTTDKKVWVWNSPWEHYARGGLDVPIDTSSIVQWQPLGFLDNSGNAWSYNGSNWVNEGHP